MDEGKMQKPALAYANDLADYDVIDDDCDLVLGPSSPKLSVCTVSSTFPSAAKGSGRFKGHQGTSILGSAPVVAKLAQTLSTPTEAVLGPARASMHGNSGVYAGGNPIISRPVSAAMRQPRTSAPGGGMVQQVEPATMGISTKFTNGFTVHSEGAATAAKIVGLESRDLGDIHGGDREGSLSWPKTGLLRRLSSLTNLSRQFSAKQAPAEVTAGAAAPAEVTAGAAAPAAVAVRKAAALSEGQGGLGAAPLEACGASRCSAAIPCVDVDLERRILIRRFSLHDGPAAPPPGTAGQSSKDIPGLGAAEGRPLQADEANAAAVAAGAAAGAAALHTQAGSAGARRTTNAASGRPSTPLRRLSRLLSGSHVAPSVNNAPSPEDQRDQNGPVGANKERITSAGVGRLFSRPSSARRKSETGCVSQGPSQTQVPMEAWKHSRPRQPIVEDVPENDRVREFGMVVVRQPSGVFKRAASALAAAIAR